MGCCQSVSDKGAVGGVSSSHDNLEAAEAAALVLGTASFTSKVEISISCRNLPKMDVTSKSEYVSKGYSFTPALGALPFTYGLRNAACLICNFCVTLQSYGGFVPVKWVGPNRLEGTGKD